MAHRRLLLLFTSLAGSASFTVRSHAPRFAARRTEGTAVLHPRVLPTASMPPSPPPPSKEIDDAIDNYLNECAAYAAGVDSAEARLAMFRLETLAQKDLKEETPLKEFLGVFKAIFQAVTSGWILILIGKNSGMTMSSTLRLTPEDADTLARAFQAVPAGTVDIGVALAGVALGVAATLVALGADPR